MLMNIIYMIYTVLMLVTEFKVVALFFMEENLLV